MVRGETYNKQLFESETFRHFINIFLNKESGVTRGCNPTKEDEYITIETGNFVIQGGFLREVTGTKNKIPSEAGYYKLVYEIDLSKTNTKDEFKQGSYKFVKALGDYPSLTQEDLENGGTVFQLPFCQFKITETGLEDFKDLREFIDYGIYARSSDFSYIMATIKNTQEISNGDNYLVKLNTVKSKGNFFEITSEGKVKVLKNCLANLSSKVFIDGSAGEGYVLSKIKINNKGISNSLERIINRDFTQSVDSGILYELKEGDLISLTVDYSSTSGNPKIRQGEASTNLLISTF